MTKSSNYCALILTHGRPHNVKTLKSLERAGYTGDVYLICDDEDEALGEYVRLYGDMVKVFSKDDIASRFDECDSGGSRSVIFYARNAAFDIAAELGYEYFIEMDDDYRDFQYRSPRGGKLLVKPVMDADRLFGSMFEWLRSSNQFECVALAQGGDMLGGANKPRKMLRKAMNVIFCRVDGRFPFVGRINEDVSTYCTLGMRGRVFATFCGAIVVQTATQSQGGGMTEAYMDKGTYVKSMYTVIQCPSFVTVRMMGVNHKRLHHHIDRRHSMPMILREDWAKRFA